VWEARVGLVSDVWCLMLVSGLVSDAAHCAEHFVQVYISATRYCMVPQPHVHGLLLCLQAGRVSMAGGCSCRCSTWRLWLQVLLVAWQHACWLGPVGLPLTRVNLCSACAADVLAALCQHCPCRFLSAVCSTIT
jgi:hypothetical protein